MDNGIAHKAKVVVTIDVEDWPQSTLDSSFEITERSSKNTEKLLDILAKHEKKVTMFILGKFAERFPTVVKRIASGGHEIASHGYGHIEIFHQHRGEFRKDVLLSKTILEDLIGKPVLGYRAPDFSIVPTTLWALDILSESGYQYDSSIFPIRGKRYGIPTWPTQPVSITLPSGREIVEIPLSTVTFLNHNLPVSGGGYHRLLPSFVIQWSISHCLKEGGPFITYAHPYEFDAEEFENLEVQVPIRTRLYQGIGRRGFRAKFEKILNSNTTTTAISLIENFRWPEYRYYSQDHLHGSLAN